MATATCVGGPLDGQQVHSRGSWSIYRDDMGNPIPTRRGDREFGTFAGRPLSRYYVQQWAHASTVYVHATVFDAWRSGLLVLPPSPPPD